MAEFRVNINVSSGYNAHLLQLWAARTSQPLSNLAGQLLIEGLNIALRDGRIPAPIVAEANEEFFAPKPGPADPLISAEVEGEEARRELARRMAEAVEKEREEYRKKHQGLSLKQLQKLVDELP